MPFETNILDPALYEKVRRPVMEAEQLPAWCYTSPEFYEREVDRIFMRTWNFVGRADLIPKPGDYLTVDLVGVPVILIHGDDGVIRAFSNACRHRGTRLLSSEGNCRAIRCPYHSWTYSLDGTLRAAAGMEETQNFDLADYGLTQFRLATWEGFLFINFSQNDKSLIDYLGDLPEILGSYNFSEMICTRRKIYDVACNWKVYIENQREAYHVSTVHRTSLGSQVSVQLTTSGNWSGAFLERGSTEAVLRGETASLPPIPSLTGRAAEGTYFVLVYPHTFFGCTRDCMWWMECQPQGPTRTKVIVGSCFPISTVARAEFADVVEKYYERWDTSHPEDNEVCELQQQGLISPFNVTGRIGTAERGVHTIDNWILDQVLDGEA